MPEPATVSPSTSASSQTLGRYHVLRELGRGAQGRVLLAHDPQLDRKVAIKTLHPRGSAARILDEARTIAQLRHPHIVTLHDAFEHDGGYCLVFEYVDGSTLARMLEARGRLDAPLAVRIARQVLEGLGCAHARGIVHRDVKPANVAIDGTGSPRIMDFGLASTAGTRGNAPAGTPLYMAPEIVGNGTIGPAADVFSVGMMLYEMLTGAPAVQGRNAFEVMHKIANVAFAPPSAGNPEVTEALDQIVMRALAKDPSARYADATEMLAALSSFASAEAPAGTEAAAAEGSGVVDFLLKRMRHASGFPALSQTIGAINRVTAGDEQSVQKLTDVLLRDFALTNKLLRTVNSSGFGHFGGHVSTISRAVMILGFDAVRNLAVTLVLLEHMQNKGQAARLREDVIATLFNGVVARRTSRAVGVRETEESYICGVFFNLGRLLASCYLYEDSVEIARRVQHAGVSESEASTAVLGISYEDLGIAVGRSWNLPASIVESMRRVGDGPLARPASPAHRLQLAANLADVLSTAACMPAGPDRSAAIAAVARRFGDALALNERQLVTLAAESGQEFLADAGKLLGDTSRSRVCQNLRQGTPGDDPGAGGGQPRPGADTIDGVAEQTIRIAEAGAITEGEQSAAAVLSAGIQDITDSLVGDFNLSDVLRIILETMYRGMGFRRVLLVTNDVRTRALSVRFGYGPGVDTLVKNVQVPCSRDPDVFSVALAKNVDVLISDVDAENIRARIPAWCRQHLAAGTFVLLPIVVEGRGIGLFYGDRENAGELVIEPREMNLLRTLRNQAVLALRQRR